MLSQVRPAIVATLLFTLLLGVAYPLAITGISKLAFPFQAEGSLLKDSSGKVIGSAVIGQAFAKPEYLHPRPSAAGNGYDASNSGGSNYGPLNSDLAKRVKGDADAMRASGIGEVTADSVTTSASGLDPDISPSYAFLQVDRMAKTRGVSDDQVRQVVAANVQGQWLGFIGQPHVNVLQTNLALDARFPVAHLKAP
jgi:potassium-transporting ATPase KdpC subunit